MLIGYQMCDTKYIIEMGRPPCDQLYIIDMGDNIIQFVTDPHLATVYDTMAPNFHIEFSRRYVSLDEAIINYIMSQ